MLAARMYNKKDIRVEEAPIPAIEEDGILLKVKAAGHLRHRRADGEQRL